MKYTTRQAAKIVGVHRVTLQNWITDGNVPAPKVQNIGGGSMRLWSKHDVAKARKAIKKKPLQLGRPRSRASTRT
jgi:excisionase family DNA binding protein